MVLLLKGKVNSENDLFYIKEMKNKTKIIGALLLTLAVSSCHKDADTMLNYAYDDDLSFAEAQKSYAGKFRVFWNAMNQNYTLWDYEEENGVNWDEVYDKYLPQFEALDKPGTEVTDSALKALMTEVVAPLHDGHMSVEFVNHQTNNRVAVSPGTIRNYQRDDAEEANGFQPSMYNYYMKNQLKRYLNYDATALGQLANMVGKQGIGLQWVRTRIAELNAKSSLTESEVIQYEGLTKLNNQMVSIMNQPTSSNLLNSFNALVQQYSYLNVPFLEQIDPRFAQKGLSLEFAQTNDDIAYLQFSNFSLSVYLKDEVFNQELGGIERNSEIRQHVVRVWQAWFNTIQDLHKSGRLKGVIIDVRNNSGGYMSDANYVLGALLPSGGMQYGWSRFKRGVGRYDFSPFMPKYMETMDKPHEIIDDCPIVVLANSSSVSMAEMTSLSVQQLENGKLIGRRTFGGVCGLIPNNYNSENYSGHIGVDGVTPVYVYLPTECIFNINKKPLEGIGVTPDIEVPFNPQTYQSTGNDTQIDRALEFIRTGK